MTKTAGNPANTVPRVRSHPVEPQSGWRWARASYVYYNNNFVKSILPAALNLSKIRYFFSQSVDFFFLPIPFLSHRSSKHSFYFPDRSLSKSNLAFSDLWRPDDRTKRAEHIYVLKATPGQLVLYHCTQGGGGRAFSLVLRRTPTPIARWDWHDIRKLLFTFQLPNVVRFSPVCDTSDCTRISSEVCVLALVSAVVMLRRFC